jgi:rhamnose utilization protein RhaD (predicted bifunctional aldolase and dehydrogenase)
MPKKKKAATKVVKKVSKKTVKVIKKAAKKTKQASPQKPSRASAPKIVKKPVAANPVIPIKLEPSLGRPLVTQEEKLYMLFHDDYQSRQVFEFLRVDTIKDLEEFTPQQIVHLMSRPIRLTVDRIRQRLAQFKRSLKDDEQYATEFRQAKDDQPKRPS